MHTNVEIKSNVVTVTRYRDPRRGELTKSDKALGATAVAESVVITFGKDEPEVTFNSDICHFPV